MKLRENRARWVTFNAILVYAFLYAPILVLVIFSFNASKSTAVWRGFTLDWYGSLLGTGDMFGMDGGQSSGAARSFQADNIWLALRNSLIVSSTATLSATTLGTMLALAIERYRFRLRGFFNVLLYLPVVIPDITLGIALMVFFSLLFKLVENCFGVRLALGFGTIIVSHVAFNISYVAIVVRARLAGMNRTLEEAAQDLGATPWQTFRRITLPLIGPGIAGGALLAFTLSLDDFVVTFFTTGIGSSTLPIFVYGMIRFTVTPAINAISTLMLLVSIVLVVGAVGLQRWGE
ncbi:MAG: ABC transporter permease [Caldilineaceae bacterium]